MLTITPIPALDSNYFWVIRPDSSHSNVYLVDPGDPSPVIEYLTRTHLSLAGILITHRHRDHTHGIADLLKQWPVPVYGPDSDLIPLISHTVADGDRLDLDGILLKVIGVPGHTWEHIAYFAPCADHPSPPLLFCGDALFAGGCGRRFDGTAEIMWDSLGKLAALPDDTRVYCAHEYTLANLTFAVAVEPDNRELRDRLTDVSELRAGGNITLPSILGVEKQTNPFLRCDQPAVKAFAKQYSDEPLATPAAVFGALRFIKDTWTDTQRDAR